MELYHSEGGYPFLELDPYVSGLEEGIAQTGLSNSPACVSTLLPNSVSELARVKLRLG